jgi:O-antigen ligase
VVGVAGLYLALLVAATIASRNPAQSLSSLSEIMHFGTLLLAVVGLRGERRIRGLVDALILLGAVVALSGLLQLLAGYGSIDRRIRGPFSHYMTFAGILLMLDLLLVARLLLRSERQPGHGPTPWLDRPAVAWSAVVVINLALVVSLTRSAWLALVLALAALFGTVRPRLLLALPPAAVLFLVLAPVPIVNRVLSIADLSDASNYDRIAMAEAGTRMIAEEPLLGVGPDQVRRLYPLYRDPSAPRLLTPHLHDSYLQVAAERGLPALACYLALFGIAARVAWKGFRAGQGRAAGTADLHLGSLAALVGFSIAALFENNWGDTEVQRLVLFLLAVPFCLEAGASEGGSGAGEAPE